MNRTTLTFACVILSALFVSAPADAGLYRLDVTLINMTPDPVSDAARTCSRRFARLLSGANYDEVTIDRMGETAFRRTLNNPSTPFAEWGPIVQEAIEEDRIGSGDYAGVIAFECRPEDNLFIGLSANEMGRAVVRHQGPITRRTLQFMVRRLSRDAAGF